MKVGGDEVMAMATVGKRNARWGPNIRSATVCARWYADDSLVPLEILRVKFCSFAFSLSLSSVLFPS